MSHKYAPPFATLALVQSTGGAYTRDATFSLAITPPLDREMFSSSVIDNTVLLYYVSIIDARWRDATDASGRLASFRVERRGSRALPQSSWCVHRCCGRSAHSWQPSSLNQLSIEREMFSSSVDAGLVLALSFHHGDLEPDCVEVSTRGGLCTG